MNGVYPHPEDDLDDALDFAFAEYFPERQEPLPTTWAMKNGTVVKIKDMRPTHLQNTYMMLCRAGATSTRCTPTIWRNTLTLGK